MNHDETSDGTEPDGRLAADWEGEGHAQDGAADRFDRRIVDRLEAGLVRMTNPGNPRAPNQRYVINEEEPR